MSPSPRTASLVLSVGAAAVGYVIGHDEVRAAQLQHLPASLIVGSLGTSSSASNVVQVYASPITHAEIEAPGPTFYAYVQDYSAMTWS